MGVKEVWFDDKVSYTVLDDDTIICHKGDDIKRDEAVLTDVAEPPKRPKEGPIDLVQHNIWGHEIFRENEEIYKWKDKCIAARRANEAAHKRQKKEFDKMLTAKLKDLKRKYRVQERTRIQNERAAQRRLAQIKRDGARAYLLRSYAQER